MSYSMPKLYMWKDSRGEGYNFPQLIGLKVIIIAQVKLELAYFKAIAQHFT